MVYQMFVVFESDKNNYIELLFTRKDDVIKQIKYWTKRNKKPFSDKATTIEIYHLGKKNPDGSIYPSKKETLKWKGSIYNA